MYCSRCGAELSGEARFCARCGAPVLSGEGPGQGGPAPAAAEAGKATSTGLQPNLAGLFSYVLGWLSGVIFFLIEKHPFVRFHAMQSILTFGGLTCVSIVLRLILAPLRLWVVLDLLNSLVWLASLALWVLLMAKAYRGERFKLPLAGDLAERYAGTGGRTSMA